MRSGALVVDEPCGRSGSFAEMFLRLFRLTSVIGALSLVLGGCDVESGNMPAADSGPSPTEGGATDLGRDMTVPTGCDDNGDCADGVDCTTDLCEVGGVCRNVPDDGACASGQRCNPRGGCGSNACSTPADCDDGQLCNGRERCVVGMCFPAELPETCDDGVACTLDRCDATTNRCVREFGPGCMPEAGPRDGGVPPFDPTRDYSGSFRLLPAQSCESSGCVFSVSTLLVSVSSGTLTINGGGFTMTQSPAPTGPEFDVQGPGICGSARLVATFGDSASFTGRWMGSYPFECGSTDNPVAGSRF